MTNQGRQDEQQEASPPQPPTAMFNVRLPHVLIAKIAAFAERHGLTRSQAVRSILEGILK